MKKILNISFKIRKKILIKKKNSY